MGGKKDLNRQQEPNQEREGKKDLNQEQEPNQEREEKKYLYQRNFYFLY